MLLKVNVFDFTTLYNDFCRQIGVLTKGIIIYYRKKRENKIQKQKKKKKKKIKI
jgi:hypothetical protein